MTAKARILLAEDEPQLRQLNYIILSKAGYQVDLAPDGEIAWDLLKKQKYELVLTDNSMPRMKGVELIRRMMEAGIKIPVVLATACMTAADEVEFGGLKVAGRLMKPFRIDELLGMVKSALAQGEKRSWGEINWGTA